MAKKMATIDKAEELLEKVRSASWDSAVQGYKLLSTILCSHIMSSPFPVASVS